MFDSICSQKPNRAEYKVNKTTRTSSSPIIWTLHGQYFHDTKKNLAERNRNSNNGVDLRQMTLNINAYLKQRAKSVARMAFSSICMTSSYSSCLMLLRISFPCQKEIICIDLKRKKLYRSELSQEIAQIDVNNAWGAKMLKVFTPVHIQA